MVDEDEIDVNHAVALSHQVYIQLNYGRLWSNMKDSTSDVCLILKLLSPFHSYEVTVSICCVAACVR